MIKVFQLPICQVDAINCVHYRCIPWNKTQSAFMSIQLNDNADDDGDDGDDDDNQLENPKQTDSIELRIVRATSSSLPSSTL